MRKLMAVVTRFLLLCAALAGSVGGMAQVDAADASYGGVRVQVREGLLSVELGEGVPLGEVLRAVSEQAGFYLSTQGDLGDVLSQAFVDVPLEKGIERLVGDHSLAMIHDPPARRLAEVRIYEASHRERRAIEPLPTPVVFLFPPNQR